MVFLEHRPRVAYYSLTTVAEATVLLFVRQHAKGAIIVDHVTPPRGKKMATLPDCERSATVVLPTAANAGFISGDLGTSAALDVFSTVYELPLTHFEIRQTNTRTCTITIHVPRYALRTREVNIIDQNALLRVHEGFRPNTQRNCFRYHRKGHPMGSRMVLRSRVTFQ